MNKSFLFLLDNTSRDSAMAKGSRILVVDDSNTNIVLLDVVLEKEGFEVITASSAREAMKYLETGLPDLILLDILMPQTNGLELLESLKKDTRLSDIPVIMVTAVGSEDYRQRAAELGAIDYMEKPIDVPLLLKRIKALL